MKFPKSEAKFHKGWNLGNFPEQEPGTRELVAQRVERNIREEPGSNQENDDMIVPEGLEASEESGGYIIQTEIGWLMCSRTYPY